MQKCLSRFSNLLLVLFLLACASTEKRRSFGEVVDDAFVSNRLKIRYFKDKVVKGTRINIDTWKGVVTLKGEIDSQEQINRAIELAERQKGVSEVKSYLVLKGSPEIVEMRRDSPSRSPVEEKDLTPEKPTNASSSSKVFAD